MTIQPIILKRLFQEVYSWLVFAFHQPTSKQVFYGAELFLTCFLFILTNNLAGMAREDCPFFCGGEQHPSSRPQRFLSLALQVFDQIRFPKKERFFFCHASFSSVVVFHQPIWKNMRKSNWDHLPKDRGENRKYFKPPPSKIVLKIIVLKITVSPKPPSSFSTGAAPFVLGSTLLRLGCFSTTCSCRARRRIVPFPSRWSSIYKTRRPPCS